MKQKFLEVKVRVHAKIKLIQQADAILQEYHAQGYQLTLRQLYYQFVARDILPNKLQSYKMLGNAVNDGRLQGMIDWEMIDDRMRTPESNPHWDDPESIIDSAARSFALDSWEGQSYRVEAWVEKDALSGVIARPSRALDITHFATRGYVSQSALYRASKRIQRRYFDDKARTIILHLGDHDPSGIDMSRDIEERLEMFRCGGMFEFKRIALNMDQIEEYSPPPNPAKMTDSRINGYLDKYGDESWELDALPPQVIDTLIRDNVSPYLDTHMRELRLQAQESQRVALTMASTYWEELQPLLKDKELLTVVSENPEMLRSHFEDLGLL